MATNFKLSVVAPDRTVYEGGVVSVTAPGHDGYLGVLAGHEPMILALKPGLLEYRDSADQTHFIAVGGGFMEVSGASAIVLADDAQLATEIDIRHAEAQLEEARRALRGESSSLTTDEAQLELDRAMTRIKAARMVQ